MKLKINELIRDFEWASHSSITYGDGSMTFLEIEFYARDNYYI